MACRISCIVPLLALFSHVFSQSLHGASYFAGGGIPGSGPYELVDDYQPEIFLSKFNYYNSYDPTYGHVQYVNESIAEQNGYVKTNGDSVFIGVDTTGMFPAPGPGRPAVRLISDNTYTHGLFVLDLSHMPYGCGTWPAFWLLGPDWPSNGEIDVIEGVHTSSSNTISLHSSDDCTIAGTGQSGRFTDADCYAGANDNSGCGSVANNTAVPNNYGEGLSDVGGGVYITEWTSAYIRVWFFARDKIPGSVTAGSPDVSAFGLPIANFQGSCDIDSHFKNHSVIINTDFCGAWGGFSYSRFPDCPMTAGMNGYDSCVNYVGKNPDAFVEAYWQINSLQIYQLPVDVSPSSVSTSTMPLSSAQPESTGSNPINPGMGMPTSSLPNSVPYSGPLSSVPSTTTTSSATVAATPIICNSYNSSVWTDYSGQTYSIACGSNLVASSLNDDGYPVDSFEVCLELCDTSEGCSGVSFLGGNEAGTCHLKTGNGALDYDGHTFAAIQVPSNTSASSTELYPAPPRTATLHPTIQPTSCPEANNTLLMDENGLTYSMYCSSDTVVGSFADTYVDGGFTACFTICDVTPSCVGFTFVGASSGICYFKNQSGGLKPAPEGFVVGLQSQQPVSSSSAAATSSTPATSSSRVLSSTSAGSVEAPSIVSPSSVSSASILGTTVSSSSLSASAYISEPSWISTSSPDSSPSMDPVIVYYVAPACPLSIGPICGLETPTTCSISNGKNFNIRCGRSYTGRTIDSSIKKYRIMKRVTEPSYQDCLDLCDYNVGCVGVNYKNTECTLFSEITGTVPDPDNVAATVLPPMPVTSTTYTSTESVPVTSSSTLVSVPQPPTSSASSSVSTAISDESPSSSVRDTSLSIPTSASLPPLTSASSSTPTSMSDVSLSSSAQGSSLSSSAQVTSLSSSAQDSSLSSAAQDTSLPSSAQDSSVTSLAKDTSLSSTTQVTSLSSTARDTSISTTVPPSILTSESAASPSSSATYIPTCPDDAGSAYLDSNGVSYSVACYTDFAGGNLLSPFGADTLATCLPSCDTTSGCIGVVYNTESHVCQLKSTFSGRQTANVTIMFAVRAGASDPGAASSQISSALSSGGTGVGGSTISNSSSSSPTSILIISISSTTGSSTTTVVSGSVTSVLGDSATNTTVSDATASIINNGSSSPASAFNVTTSASGSGTVTVTSTTYISDASSASSTNSSTSVSGSLCFTCGLTPTVVTGGGSGATATTGAGSGSGACNAQVPGPVGTMTVFTTETITACPSPLICPTEGFGWGGGLFGSNFSSLQSPTAPGAGAGGGVGGGGGGGGNAGPGPAGSPTVTTVGGSTATPVCPGSDGHVFTDSMGQLYEIGCNSYITDRTVAVQNRSSLASCIDACDVHNMMSFTSPSSCLGVSYFSSLSSQNCELKGGQANVSQPGVDSARLISLSPGSDDGTGGGGGDYGSGSVAGTVTDGPETGPGTGLDTGVSYVPSTVYGVSTAVSTYVSNGQTVVSTYGVSTAVSVVYVPATTSPGIGSGTGPGTGLDTGISLIPSTVYGISTAISTYITNGQTILSTYGVSTAISIVYIPTTTRTVTTTTVSISVSVSERTVVSTAPGATVVSTAPGPNGGSGVGEGGGGGGGTVTVTASGGAGGGGSVTVTQIVTSYLQSPSSPASSSTCRTYATNYLNGMHGRKLLAKKSSVFEGSGVGGQGGLVLGDVAGDAPGAVPLG